MSDRGIGWTLAAVNLATGVPAVWLGYYPGWLNVAVGVFAVIATPIVIPAEATRAPKKRKGSGTP